MLSINQADEELTRGVKAFILSLSSPDLEPSHMNHLGFLGCVQDFYVLNCSEICSEVWV